ncbi:TetR/AcrR family transcriptional regulator [Streptomyces sp. SL13]|uniref:TetR/AcrR family transcriptional regulator n=1 Tax=Streptantibioticus silvisoli TaxID=2705255 RepID=A0AA90K1C1_9ACTN|nr:TetR/AcrR family transcriptional regulator [Streptantibioticus silvisoli]MDI5967083.1 TetR/AcrR family transcriptional regulator [Streptantibioticus silvisoli]MDI5973736.1 TetR/AcrR family transcriptional regulator [Streptantibioticus silvisoli]
MPPPVKRSVGHHHGNLRSALEEAALELIARSGPRGFTLAEASRRAGVSVAAPYKHYADREALLASLAERGYAEQRRRFTAALALSQDPVEQLAAFASAYVLFAVEERALFEIIFAAGLDKSRYPTLAQAGNDVLALLTVPCTKVRGTGPAARELLLTVSAAAHGLAVFLLEGVFGPTPDCVDATRQRAAAAAKSLAAAA